MYRLLFWTHNINKNPIIQTLIFRFHLELLQPSQIHFPRYSAFTRNNLEEKGVPRFINQPTHLCLLQTHACKQTHIYTRMQTHRHPRLAATQMMGRVSWYGKAFGMPDNRIRQITFQLWPWILFGWVTCFLSTIKLRNILKLELRMRSHKFKRM